MPSLRLQTLLNAGEFVVSAELTPPRHYDASNLLMAARKMAEFVDVVQINDNLLSQARLSNLVVAHKLAEIGLEPVIQFTLRHKNRIALQSDLLGMAALNLRNIMVLGGYPCTIGTDPQAKDATDIGSVEAIACLHALTTRGELFNGERIEPAPDFYVGTIDFPCAQPEDLAKSMERLTAKIDSGARYIQVQAVFDLAPLQAWMAEVRARGLHQRAHFIAAIFPFNSVKRLEFLRTIPGLMVPPLLIQRISDSADQERASLETMLDLIAGVRAIVGVHGLHLRSIGSEDWVPRLVAAAGLRTATGVN
ncbi:methylenetetrahydrofolate reductase [Anthocerotibacter panamensis]|uniref:methylenetetrahydrofolate reductase n=1 Tax=Anthocerotibacter panamensis TaxID=2857077 RepID=UPI001C40241C|nr:methylenetetrahydrofolate reductase [Anthocerotibacter panamensis]